MRRFAVLLLFVWVAVPQAHATVFGQLRGVVHDAQHRPVRGAQVTVSAARSGLTFHAVTNEEGEFQMAAVPLGDYSAVADAAGFAELKQTLTLASGTSPVLHFELAVSGETQTVAVQSVPSETANVTTVTPTTLLDRADIAQTPGADRTNSLAAITGFVPGAYVTHDQLHIRGGHQVSWLIDGVPIPNTNIASNLGAQIDPKDIDYIEVQRGSYTADAGDRTYGVFNVVPRTGFERSREGELVLSAGNFFQTDDQISFGDHSETFAYYASLNGNRSDYGLSPPVGHVLHDAANGYGGFASLIDNRTPRDQFRLVAQLRRDFFQIPYDADPDSFGNQQFQSSGLRDTEGEIDGLTDASWVHTFRQSAVLQLSPFFHYNRADYEGASKDTPVATTSERGSTYAGVQAAVTADVKRNTLQGGLFAYGQHDSYLFGAVFNDGSGTAPFRIPDAANGGVVEGYLSDNWKLTRWLTVIAGVRQTHFEGQFGEDATSPRAGVAVRVPRVNAVFRGFYGRFYQPPPLLTAAGPVVQLAQSNNTGFAPLHGERDEEHQFGVQIPFRGWLLDADSFKTRVNNFLDHSNIGNSSIYFPVTVDGALVRAWELSLRSPRLGHFGQLHLAYSNQIAEQRGAITGGLVCAPAASPQCDADPVYRPVDHDQRNTLNVGLEARLPWRTRASTDVNYGSGFTNGNPDATTPYPDAYLPAHTTFDLAMSKDVGERITVAVNALNVGNRRVLLDNSLTFGGFHFNDPRAIYGEVRYRFKF